MYEQDPLLKAVYDIIPKGIEVMLAADRFYGTAALISLCQSLGWQYRIRLKGNLNLFHQEGWVMNSHEAKKLEPTLLRAPGRLMHHETLSTEGYTPKSLPTKKHAVKLPKKVYFLQSPDSLDSLLNPMLSFFS